MGIFLHWLIFSTWTRLKKTRQQSLLLCEWVLILWNSKLRRLWLSHVLSFSPNNTFLPANDWKSLCHCFKGVIYVQSYHCRVSFVHFWTPRAIDFLAKKTTEEIVFVQLTQNPRTVARFSWEINIHCFIVFENNS